MHDDFFEFITHNWFTICCVLFVLGFIPGMGQLAWGLMLLLLFIPMAVFLVTAVLGPAAGGAFAWGAVFVGIATVIAGLFTGS